MNKWVLAIKKRGTDPLDISGMTIIDPPKGFYYADPFLKDGYVFFELYDYNKGVIAVAKINDDLTISEPQVIINEPTHISFPCVYENYMVIESVLSGELPLYKCVGFPENWEKVGVVAKGRYDDPIIFKTDKWHIITSEDGKVTEFIADTPESEWTAIRREDRTYHRPAGNVFIRDGKRLRPLQDCTEHYGKAIVIENEQGGVVKRIEPDWMPELTGTHTFNVDENYIIIDGRIHVS
jgi:hypothetical protein